MASPTGHHYSGPCRREPRTRRRRKRWWWEATPTRRRSTTWGQGRPSARKRSRWSRQPTRSWITAPNRNMLCGSTTFWAILTFHRDRGPLVATGHHSFWTLSFSKNLIIWLQFLWLPILLNALESIFICSIHIAIWSCKKTINAPIHFSLLILCAVYSICQYIWFLFKLIICKYRWCTLTGAFKCWILVLFTTRCSVWIASDQKDCL